MFATIHISTSARPRLAAWLTSRVTLWSVAENSVTSPTPASAIATPNRKLSMRRVSASHMRVRKLKHQSLSSSLSLAGTGGAGAPRVWPVR